VNAFMLVASPAKEGDPSRARKVFLKEGRRLVGEIFLPDGMGCGYRFRRLGRAHASSMRYPTIKAAKEGLAKIL
jgi:hypothetical protein